MTVGAKTRRRERKRERKRAERSTQAGTGDTMKKRAGAMTRKGARLREC